LVELVLDDEATVQLQNSLRRAVTYLRDSEWRTSVYVILTVSGRIATVTDAINIMQMRAMPLLYMYKLADYSIGVSKPSVFGEAFDAVILEILENF